MKTALPEELNQPEAEPKGSAISAPTEMRTGVGRQAIFALKALILPLLLLASLRDASGALVSADQARDAVSGWLKTDHSPLQTAIGQQVKRVETFTDDQGSPLYYVAYLDPEGFVIVAADDLVEPIIGFADGGRFDPATDNPLGALVSRDLPGRIAKAKSLAAAKVEGSALAARNKWERFKTTEQTATDVELGLSTISDVRVAPLTTTLWDQLTVGGNACYNYYTPPNAAGSAANYYCGCVATAMSQLMRFWQWPVNGVGTTSFTITVGGSSQSRSLRGGDGSGGAYVWSSMVTNPASSTLAQRQAIGALCADAGVAVNMDYESGGSGTDTLLAKNAFVSTFGYANAIKGYNNNSTIGAGLVGMVNPNLDAGCPVLFGITDGSSGHAIVCDGYGYNSSTLYHHLNLGWSGTATAWYNLPTIDAGGYTFNSIYKCVYNVWTNGAGEIISGRVTEGGTPITGVVLTATRSGGGTYTVTNNAQGIYAFAKIPSSSTYTIGASKTGYAFTNRTVVTGLSSDYSATSGNQWAIDFGPSDANNPTSFTATPAGSSTINLAWGKDPANDNVMVAWNTTPTFGIPSGTYSAGNAISGGGTVLYNGSATTASHAGLTPGTTYYYRAWSVRSGPTYSTGLTCSATLAHDLLLTEDFEHGGSIPSGWTQEYVTGAASWIFQTGDSYGHPASAHGGTYNALLYYGASGDHKTKLVTSALNFGSATRNAQLTFWHCMEVWTPDQDELRVYYKTSAGGSWTLLATYTTSLAAWTQQTISLPNPNSTYYIGFEGNAKYGYGVCLDDLVITADLPLAPLSPRMNITLSGTNLVINCTNGSALGTYYVLASTNLAMPWTNWPAIATNSFDGIGCSRYTNWPGANVPRRFYRLQAAP